MAQQPPSPYPPQAHVPTYGMPGPAAGQPAPPYAPVPPGAWAPPPPPAPPRRTGRVVAAVAAGGVAAVGVAAAVLLVLDGATLDTAEVESRIAEESEAQAGVRATDVECPADVAAEAGDTFRCAALLDGQAVTFTVRQEDDRGNVRFDLDDEIVLMDLVEQSVADQVSADYGVPVAASCDAGGRRVLVDGTQTPLPCTVTNLEDAADSIAVVANVGPDGTVQYAGG